MAVPCLLAAVHFYCIYYDNYNYHNISHTILDMATYIRIMIVYADIYNDDMK